MDLKFKDGLLTYKDIEYVITDIEKMDNKTIHLTINGNVKCFVISDTTINGKAFDNADDFINNLNINK